MSVPLVHATHHVGTLDLKARAGRRWRPAQLALIRTAAGALGAALGARLELERLRRVPGRDPVTGLPDARAFRERFDEELSRARRHGLPLAIVAIDLDHFGALNARHGRNVGDDVLCEAALVLKLALRESDVIARLGGDGFAVVLPETEVGPALRCADRVRRALEEHHFPAPATSRRRRAWPPARDMDSTASSSRAGRRRPYRSPRNPGGDAWSPPRARRPTEDASGGDMLSIPRPLFGKPTPSPADVPAKPVAPHAGESPLAVSPPVSAESRPVATATAMPPAAAPSRRGEADEWRDFPRILVVDDEPSVIDVFREFLSAQGYELSVAKNAEEAMRLTQELQPDIILTDINLPGHSGLDVMRHAKSLDPEVAVIVVTGYASASTAIDALRQGAYDYVTKPFDLDEVHQIVERGIANRRLKAINRQLVEELRQKNEILQHHEQELREKVAQATRQMTTLYDAGLAINTNLELQPRLDTICFYAAQLMAARGAIAYLKLGELDEFHAVAATGVALAPQGSRRRAAARGGRRDRARALRSGGAARGRRRLVDHRARRPGRELRVGARGADDVGRGADRRARDLRQGRGIHRGGRGVHHLVRPADHDLRAQLAALRARQEPRSPQVGVRRGRLARDPHAADLGQGRARAALRRPLLPEHRAAGQAPDHRPRQRRAAARADQRHPRLLEARGRLAADEPGAPARSSR